MNCRLWLILPLAATVALAGFSGCAPASKPAASGGSSGGSTGASSGGASSAGASSAGVSESGYKRRTADDLPAVSDSLPPQGKGRVEISGPDGWHTLSRTSGFLARFVRKENVQVPRIQVVEEEKPPAKIHEDTTEANAHELAAALDGELKRDPAKQVPEPCLPIVLADRTFVRHVRLARMEGDPVVIQSLQTVVGGRLYTVELICAVNAANGREYEQSLKTFRDYGYAVAANLKFDAAAEPLAPLAAEQSPAQPPPPEASTEKPAAPQASGKASP